MKVCRLSTIHVIIASLPSGAVTFPISSPKFGVSETIESFASENNKHDTVKLLTPVEANKSRWTTQGNFFLVAFSVALSINLIRFSTEISRNIILLTYFVTDIYKIIVQLTKSLKRENDYLPMAWNTKKKVIVLMPR